MARISRKSTKEIPGMVVADDACRAGMYLRLSVEDNGKKESDSIENQRAYLREYVSTRPYLEVVDIYADNGFTGTDFARPEFNRMMNDAKTGRINCVIVKDLSRLGRNYVETGNLVEKVFPFIGVRFIAVNDNYDSEFETSAGQLEIALKNVVNDMYAKDISQKSASALKAKRARGEFIANYAPYGYVKAPADKNKLIVDPESAPVVMEIFLLRAAGKGIGSIARELNKKGYPSPGCLRYSRGIVTNNNNKGYALLWNRHVLSNILHNRVYIGDLVQGKSIVGSCRDDWDVVEGTHEPIVSRELWQEVQNINDRASHRAKENYGSHLELPKRIEPYGSKLHCADCGRVIKYVRSYSKDGKRDYYHYKCPQNEELGDKACSKKNISAEELDKAVLSTIHSQIEVLLDAQKMIKSLLATKQASRAKMSSERHNKNIRTEIGRIRSIQAGLYADYRSSIISKNEYVFAKERYAEDIAKLEKEQCELNSVQEAENDAVTAAKKLSALIDKYIAATVISREIVGAFIKEIRLHDDNSINIEFNYTDELEKLIKQCEKLKEEVA